ncbi:hypothetical protein FSP39_025046 [Pinctada imbricata]|uniref:Uncharacterized protein n=1 Tax=Pinctada imbricata TaxID=66713 RepID=A0AA89BQ09_PINIB|nr:hypothetical protein FSP39_025046 [Pinctada imbricata]
MNKYVISKGEEETSKVEDRRISNTRDDANDAMLPGVDEDAIPEEDLATLTDGTDISHMRLHISNRLDVSQDDSSEANTRQRKLPFHLYKHFSFPQHVHAPDEIPDRPKLSSQFSQPVELNADSIIVVPKLLTYTVDSDTQTQTDISWEVKQCQENMSKVYYQVQIKHDTDIEWQNLSERRIPVIRLYSTDEVVVLDKRRWKFRDGAVTWMLRVRALVKDSIRNCNNLWSSVITVHIKGFPKDDPKFVADKKGSILY